MLLLLLSTILDRRIHLNFLSFFAQDIYYCLLVLLNIIIPDWHCDCIFAGYCAYIDAENAFNPSFAEAIGVDSERLLIAQPDSAENSLSIVNTLVGGSVAVVVVDSVCYYPTSLSYIYVMSSVPYLF